MQLADVGKVYFIGIGGIGMSAIARYFNGRGLPVAGYDKTETPLTRALESEGITIHYGKADLNRVPNAADDLLVVWTPAIPRDFAELVKVQTGDYTVMKRSAVLGLISSGMRCVGIAGTHGKTTTTTITTKLMSVAGLSPHAFLGGIPRDFDGNYVKGESDWVVVEADEYDRSFLQLDPTIAVILSCDPDHLDIYGDHENMLETGFRAYARRVAAGGHLIVRHDVVGQFTGVENLSSRSYENARFAREGNLSPGPSQEESGGASVRFAREGNLSPGPSPEERGDMDARSARISARNYWEIPADAYDVILKYAKKMRSEPTDAEKAMWDRLRGKQTGYKFARQKPMGYSIPDFVCVQKRVIVEIDGGYHDTPDVILSDELRDEKFAKAGYLTLRFNNDEVLSNPFAIAEKIKTVLSTREDRPYPFPTEAVYVREASSSSSRAERAEPFPLSSGEGPGERFSPRAKRATAPPTSATSPLFPGEGSKERFPNAERFLWTFGIGTGDFSAHNIHVKDGAFHFDLKEPNGHLITDIRTALPGRHNIENAVAACAVTRLAGGDEEALREGLATFRGIARRFELALKTDKIVIIDDYAHHPTELEAAITAARELYPDRTIRGVFQPHLFSRTQDFAAGFARALDLLDEAILIPIYPAREEPIPGVTSKIIYDKMQSTNRRLLTDEMMLEATAELTDGVLLLLGAGDIDALIPKIIAQHQNTLTHG